MPMRTYAEGALHRLEIASKAAKHSCEGVVVEMGHEHHKGKRGKESRWKSILMRGGPHTARPPRKVQPVCSKAGGRPACMRPNAGEDWEKLEQVGEGTFGVVYKARHRETGRIVAIKKIKLGRSQEGVQISAIDEIRVLQELRHENIVTLHEVFAKGLNISLVFDFLQVDMEALINARNVLAKPYVPMPEEDIKAYLMMMLRGVDACHQNYVLHRDLKPGNLLLSEDGVVKLADFGLARTYGSPGAKFSPQAFTRWYRPMELLLGAEEYGPASDMWSVGCIFAEMFLRVPLFAGDTDMHQVNRIVACMGTPTEATWPGYKDLKVSMQFKSIPPTPLSQVITAASKDAIELLTLMLHYDPNRRISASEALKHRYFTGGKPASECGVIARRVTNMLADASEAKRAKAEAAADGGARGGKTMAGARSLMMELAEAEGAAEGDGVVGGSKKRKADGSPGYGG